MAGAKGRSGSGGARPGAGRRRSRPGHARSAGRASIASIDWRRVRSAALAGASEEEIIRSFAISEATLEDPARLTRFRDEIARGHARFKLELRTAIKRRGLRTTERAGSVNALALQARNILEWDRQLPTQETEPDLGTARQRLRDLFAKLAEARSEIEGRTVTVLELLHREAQLDADPSPAPP